MNYIERLTAALQGNGVTVVTTPIPGVPIFDIVACPEPFEAGQALALQAVVDAALGYCTQLKARADNLKVYLEPSQRPEAATEVGIRIGFQAETEDYIFVVGPEGADIVKTRRVRGAVVDAFDVPPTPNPPFHNGLTRAETERLALLMEEMAEASQIIGKILRHGYESRWPLPDGPSNREQLVRELGHVRYAISLMLNRGDVPEQGLQESEQAKAETIHRYLHHQDPVATLTREPTTPGACMTPTQTTAAVATALTALLQQVFPGSTLVATVVPIDPYHYIHVSGEVQGQSMELKGFAVYPEDDTQEALLRHVFIGVIERLPMTVLLGAWKR